MKKTILAATLALSAMSAQAIVIVAARPVVIARPAPVVPRPAPVVRSAPVAKPVARVAEPHTTVVTPVIVPHVAGINKECDKKDKKCK